MESKLTELRNKLNLFNAKKKYGMTVGISGNDVRSLRNSLKSFADKGRSFNGKKRNDGKTNMASISITVPTSTNIAIASLLPFLSKEANKIYKHCPCHTNACPCNTNMTCSCVSVCTCNSKENGHCGWHTGARCGCNVKSFVCNAHQCTLDSCSCNCNGNTSVF